MLGGGSVTVTLRAFEFLNAPNLSAKVSECFHGCYVLNLFI